MGYFTAMGTGSFSGPSEFQVPMVLEYKILVNQREVHAVTLQKTWTLPDPAVLGSPYTCT